MPKFTRNSRPWTFALGGACVVSASLVGCSRNSLDIAKEDARTDAAMTERANESIQRSRQELASSGKSGAVDTAAAEVDPALADKPALASRWNPFRRGGPLGRKPLETADDPFLASKEDGGNGKTESKGSIAVLADEHAKAAAAAAAAAEKKTAQVDGLASAPKPKAVTPESAPRSTASQASLEEFLKSQEPVPLADQAALASSGAPQITRKPGSTSLPTATASRKSAGELFSESDSALAAAEAAPVLPTRSSSRELAASKARPFSEEMLDPHAPAEKPTSRLRQNTVAQARSRNPLASEEAAAAAPAVRQNPLAEEPVETVAAVTPARTKHGPGAEIGELMRLAKSAMQRGQFDAALAYASDARELAEQCSYEFAAEEQSPDELADWISDKRAEAQQLAHGKLERRQLVVKRSAQPAVAATPAAYSTPSARESVVAGVDPFADAPAAETPSVATAATASPFSEWASEVGRQPVSRGRAPEWPVLSAAELAESDDLWQPSSSQLAFKSGKTQAAPVANSPFKSEEPVRRPEPATQLASAVGDAPAFVATADGEVSSSATMARPSDSLVQLGQPTDIAPSHVAVGVRRKGPRLAAPPPLSLQEGADDLAGVQPVRDRSKSRTLWLAGVCGLAVVVLALFRRWAYRAAR